MKRIAFATGSRADYGIVRRYLKKLNEDSQIELDVLVTGALLDKRYGRQVSLIEDDGFHIAAEVELPLDTSNNRAVIYSMSVALNGFADVFYQTKYDLLILLGDRYEILPVAIAAAMQRIPILHIHGGEATWNNYDEFIRHSITKMSLFHFTATEEYRRRVIQLGEDPGRVFYLGALGAENCQYIDIANVSDEVKGLQEKKYFVVLFHPETLAGHELDQINAVLDAVSEFKKYQFVFIGSNADTHSEIIRQQVKDFVKQNENCNYYENLHTNVYHYLVKNSICLMGNSSSGVIEAPSLGVFTIDIGDRQRGRVKGSSVIDVPCNSSNIMAAIREVLNRCSRNIEIVNPYYKSDAALNYYEKTIELLSRLDQSPDLLMKPFHDLRLDSGSL